jgi:hypothetical protein
MLSSAIGAALTVSGRTLRGLPRGFGFTLGSGGGLAFGGLSRRLGGSFGSGGGLGLGGRPQRLRGALGSGGGLAFGCLPRRLGGSLGSRGGLALEGRPRRFGGSSGPALDSACRLSSLGHLVTLGLCSRYSCGIHRVGLDRRSVNASESGSPCHCYGLGLGAVEI